MGLGYISLVTLIIAGGAALVEVDFKKVVALSTLSQLSIIIFRLSIGLPGVAFFHLVSHAIFKALLFLCVGVVLHENAGCQDIRSLGHGWSRYPVRMSCIVVAKFSLCGVPFIRGFYSKDCIVERGLLINQSRIFFVILIRGLVLTFYYSVRIIYSAVCGVRKGAIHMVKSQEQIRVKVSYVSLFLGAVIIGYLFGDMVENFSVITEASYVDKVRIIVIGILGCSIYYTVLISMFGISENSLVFFINSIGHFKYLSGNFCRTVGLGLSDLCTRVIDKG